MNLTLIHQDNSLTQVAVQGTISMSARNPLEEPLAALLGPDAYRCHIRLDLGAAESLDSSGIGWLLACHKRIRQAGGKLELFHARPLVANVLKLMKLERVLTIESEVPEVRDTP